MKKGKLPTLDVFRARVKDAMAQGLPLDKCLDLGTTWGTAEATPEGNSNKNQFWQAKDAFSKSMRDALKSGLSIDKAIKKSLDELPPSVVPDLDWPEAGPGAGEGQGETGYLVIFDAKDKFKASMRDAMAKGKSFRDALKQATQRDCQCGGH